jgi:hypothetical protein
MALPSLQVLQWWCGQAPDIAWLCVLHTSLYSTQSLLASLGPLYDVLTRCLAVLGCAVIVSVPLRVCKTACAVNVSHASCTHLCSTALALHSCSCRGYCPTNEGAAVAFTATKAKVAAARRSRASGALPRPNIVFTAGIMVLRFVRAPTCRSGYVHSRLQSFVSQTVSQGPLLESVCVDCRTLVVLVRSAADIGSIANGLCVVDRARAFRPYCTNVVSVLLVPPWRLRLRVCVS